MAAKKSASPASEDDIPFKKPDKKNAQPEADEDEDEDEEEYAVERIVGHTFVGKGKKKLVYIVKWVGWDDTTDEPEDNLDNCPDELATYFKSIGGKPEPPSTPGANKKRAAQETLTPQSTSRGRPGASKKAKKDDDRNLVDTVGGDQWKAPEGSWESEVMAVDSMTRESNGEIIVYLVWNNKKKTRHSTKLLNHKCPQKLLAFYEAHLFFNPVKEDDEDDYSTKGIASTSNANASTAALSEKNGIPADDEDDVEMEDVKGVATTT